MSNWIVMSDGIEMDLRYPCISSISMTHIPHHLATINRYTGAAARPMCVAEHSLMVCEIAEREFGLNVHGLLAALLHDAHEAYTGDFHTPGKEVVGISWRVFEDRFARLLQDRFRVITPSLVFREQIRKADLIALATEKHQLLPHDYRGTPLRPWPCLDGIEPADWIDLHDGTRDRRTWQDWRQAFRDRFDELTQERGLRIDQGDAA